eukprot:GHVS01070169.1.p2 GENE.GHVS01070169.1~~GHVS01070169.1.p2  ORF type:complete len:101 (-),score=5.33 GHVS01070169.1:863-1165(-)
MYMCCLCVCVVFAVCVDALYLVCVFLCVVRASCAQPFSSRYRSDVLKCVVQCREMASVDDTDQVVSTCFGSHVYMHMSLYTCSPRTCTSMFTYCVTHMSI